MTNENDERPSGTVRLDSLERRDLLRERRERQDVSRPGDTADDILALRAGRMTIQVSRHGEVREAGDEEHLLLLLAVKDERTGTHLAAKVSILQLSVLAYGLGEIVRKVQHEEDRR